MIWKTGQYVDAVETSAYPVHFLKIKESDEFK